MLSQRYRTIIFDCRGTGHSSKPKDGYTVQQFAQDGIALLSHLRISRCHVVGFALGGLLAFAIREAIALARELQATVLPANGDYQTPDMGRFVDSLAFRAMAEREDTPWPPEELARRLAGKAGAMATVIARSLRHRQC